MSKNVENSEPVTKKPRWAGVKEAATLQSTHGGLGMASLTPMMGVGRLGALDSAPTPSMSHGMYGGHMSASALLGELGQGNLSAASGGASVNSVSISSTNWNNTPAVPTDSGRLNMRAFGEPVSAAGLLGAMTPMMTGNIGQQTPVLNVGMLGIATPMVGAGGFGGVTPMMSAEGPFGNLMNMSAGVATPRPGAPLGGLSDTITTTPRVFDISDDAIGALAKELESEYRKKNRRLTDEELDAILPADGYTICEPPADYVPLAIQEPNFFQLASQQLQTEMNKKVRMKDDSHKAKAGGAVRYTIPESMGPGLPNVTPQDALAFEILLKYHGVLDTKIPAEDFAKVFTMRQLLRIKNGDNSQRKSASSTLLDKTRDITIKVVTDCIVDLWASDVLEAEHKHFILKLLQRLLYQVKEDIEPEAKKIVSHIRLAVDDDDSVVKEDAKDFIALLSQTIQLEGMYRVIRDYIDNENDSERRSAAKILAIIAKTLGPEMTMAVLRPVVTSRSTFGRLTACKVLFEMSLMLKSAIIKVLPDIAYILEILMKDDNIRIKGDAARGLAMVADAVCPYGIEHLQRLVSIVREQCQNGSGRAKLITVNLRAYGSLVPLMSKDDAYRNAREILPPLTQIFATDNDELRRVILRVVQQCVSAEGVTREFIRSQLFTRFFGDFWNSAGVIKGATDRRTSLLLIYTTVEVAKKGGPTEVLQKIIPYMKHAVEDIQAMAVDAVRKIVDACGILSLPHEVLNLLVDGVFEAYRTDAEGQNIVIMEGVATVLKNLTPASNYMKYGHERFKKCVVERLSARNVNVRAQATTLMCKLVPVLNNVPEARSYLVTIQSTIFGHIDTEEDPFALNSYLRCLYLIFDAIGPQSSLYPEEIFLGIKKCLKNRDSQVQLRTVELLELIAKKSPKMIKRVELLNVARRDLFNLLNGGNQKLRRACARAFGTLALESGGPFEIVLELVSNFKQQDRKVRISTSAALAVVASTCSPLAVIPFLIDEYRACEGVELCEVIQHTVLKTLRFILEELGPICREYIIPLLPLVERAVTEANVQMRRMGIEVMKAMANAIVGYPGFEAVVCHMLNFVHPNIVELLSREGSRDSDDRLRMVTSVVQFYECARLVIGSQRLFQFLVQGLYHPAARVRSVYWRTYNIVYLANPEALIPCHPCLVLADHGHEHLSKGNVFIGRGIDENRSAVGTKRAREEVCYPRTELAQPFIHHELLTFV